MIDPVIARFRSQEHVRMAPAGRGGIVVDLASGRCFELNAVGGDIWKMVCSGMSLAAIVHEVRTAFGIDEQRAEADVTDLIESLEREGLIIRLPEDPLAA